MEELLTAWSEGTPPVDLEIERSNGNTLYDSASVYYELWRYWTYSFIGPPTRDVPLWALQCWLQYCTLYAGDLERAYDALYADYDPIANYDMTENGSAGQMLDDTTDTVTPSGKTKNTSETKGQLQTETKNYVGGYDSTADTGAFSDRSVSVTEPLGTGYKIESTTEYLDDASTETKHEYDNSMTDTELPGSGYNRLDQHHLRRTGNIGVTTSQQMIGSELELRKTELLSDFVHRFVHRHFAILGGDIT